MNMVFARSRDCSACRIIAGCVVSSTCSCFLPNVRLRTSGASDEPPIPSRTNVSNFVRASWANSVISPTRSSTRRGSSSQPSHLSSSAPVQTVASRAQIRSTSFCCVATLIGTPRADEQWKGRAEGERRSSRRQLPALRPDSFQQLVERVRELLHTLALERVGHVLVVDGGGMQIHEQLPR